MKLVREHINEKFTEDSDPIHDLGIGKKAIFKDLQERGVRMGFDWGAEAEIHKKRITDNIHQVKRIIDKLEKVGLSIKDSNMHITNSTDIYFNTYEVLDSNHVIFNCISEDDAKILIDVCKRFSIWQYDNYNISRGSDYVLISDETEKWLDDLIENRKKYIKFKKL